MALDGHYHDVTCQANTRDMYAHYSCSEVTIGISKYLTLYPAEIFDSMARNSREH